MSGRERVAGSSPGEPLTYTYVYALVPDSFQLLRIDPSMCSGECPAGTSSHPVVGVSVCLSLASTSSHPTHKRLSSIAVTLSYCVCGFGSLRYSDTAHTLLSTYPTREAAYSTMAKPWLSMLKVDVPTLLEKRPEAVFISLE